MSQIDNGNSNQKEQLNAALVEYLEAVESGNSLDQEEFLSRYPDIADELAKFISDHKQLDGIASPLRQAVQEQEKSPAISDPTMPLPAFAAPEIGAKVQYFGDYELLEEIARGGMGVVYKARQSTLKRIVALKMILSGQLAGEEDVKRFHAEAEAAAKLDHPGIVPIFEVGQHEGQHYFSMAFVEGESLARKVAHGVLAPREAAEVTKKIAQAISYAHVEGVIHRDLKPANVLLDKDGQPRVTDFGLAKRIESDSSLTATGQILGTPSYMAPEQASGKTDEVGPLSDVYSLGAVLYCLLTGRAPFQASNPLDTLMQVLEQQPVAPRQLNRSVPRDLDTICLKCLEKEPDRRYASAQEFAEDLNRYLNDEPIRARRVGRPERLRRWLWKRRRNVAAIATAACVAAVLAAFFLGRSSNELIAAADERHVANKHREALELYDKALWWTHKFNRFKIRERMVRCYQELGDTERAVEAALEMLEFDPDAWFGEQNYAVAQAILAQTHSRFSNLSDAAARDRSSLELAERRLEFFLMGPHGTEAERHEAEATLNNVRTALGIDPSYSSRDRDQLSQLPSGTPEELLLRADEAGRPVIERAAAAFAGGLRLEESGDSEASLSAYRQAYDLLRSKDPFYAGSSPGLESSRPRSLRLEPLQCRILRQVGHTIRRIDPTQPDLLRGGIRFRIVGLDLPPDLYINLSVSLRDATREDPGHGTERDDGQGVPASLALGSAPVQLDQTAWIGIADGRYRLSVRRGPIGTSYSESHGGRANRLGKLLELDFSALPSEVVIRGSTIELPPIHARLLEEVTLIEPAEGENVDLQTSHFRWSDMPDAKSYHLHFAFRTLRNGGVYWERIHTVSTEATDLSLPTLSKVDVDQLGSLTNQSTFTWQVDAFDATGKLLGRTMTKRNFKVRCGLDTSPSKLPDSE